MKKITRALGMLHFVPARPYLRLASRLELGRRLDLSNPVTLNEKLQWLKLNGAMERFSTLADKWAARAHVQAVLGREYLVPALGLYERPEQVPWADLPAPFVAKCTHGSHCGVICLDKAGFDAAAAARHLAKWLRRDWYWFGREPVYRGIPHRVLVEKFIGVDGQLPDDYKVMCFHGVPRVMQLHEKAGGVHRIGFYDTDGKRLDIRKGGFPPPLRAQLDPARLKPLLDAAARLAQSVDTPYLRVDLYQVGGRGYFSEFTFFDSSGFKPFLPQAADEWLGSLVTLDPMNCPRCGGKMKWTSIEGGVERYDRCAHCGYERMTHLESEEYPCEKKCLHWS